MDVLAIFVTTVVMTRPTGCPVADSPTDSNVIRSLFTQVSEGGLCLGKTYETGGTIGEFWTGWRLTDGSLIVCNGSGRASLSYWTTVFEDETYRCTAGIGLPTTLMHEWYLGYGVGVVFETITVPLHARIGVRFHLIEALTLTFGIDLLSCGWDFGWGVQF
jgi:hypothetical protein